VIVGGRRVMMGGKAIGRAKQPGESNIYCKRRGTEGGSKVN